MHNFIPWSNSPQKKAMKSSWHDYNDVNPKWQAVPTSNLLIGLQPYGTEADAP